MKLKTLTFFTFLFFAAPSVQAAEMSVEKAYASIPHARTQYSPQQSSASEEEKKFLDHLFFVTDLALQKRMMMLGYFNKQNENQYLETYNKSIDEMVATFSLIKAPNAVLDNVAQTIVIAIRQQQKFFNDWAAVAGTPQYEAILYSGYRSNAHVQGAHQNLLKAYMLLKQAYPNETAHNQQAFYDHLCALDFI